MQFLNENQIRLVADAATSAGTDVESAVVDTANWEQVTFWASIATANAANFLQVQQGDESDLSDAADLTGAKAIAGEDGDIVAVTVNRPLKRYLRVVIDRGGADTVTGQIYCALTGSRTVPVDNDVDDEIVSAIVSSPDVDTSTYTLTYTAGDNGEIVGTTPQYVLDGADGTEVTATADTNFEFAAWSDGVATAARTDEAVTGPIDVLATFQGEEYTVTFSATDADEAPSPATKDVRHAGVYGDLPVVTREGYTFDGWRTADSGAGTLVESDTAVTATANHTLYADWTALEYTVTFDSQSGSTPDPATKDVTFGSTYGTLPTVTRTGYTFGGWYTEAAGAGDLVEAATTVATAEAHTLYAAWTADTMTVTFSAADADAPPDPATKEVTYDAAYGALPTVARTGYTFEGWRTADAGAGDLVESTTTVTATANHTLYADWLATGG